MFSDRYRVSCRATAAIVNAALEDMGLLNDSSTQDRKKVAREKVRFGMENVMCSKVESSGLVCIGFDKMTQELLLVPYEKSTIVF